MKTKKINAIILSRRDFGEADRLISAFSLEEGKIKIIAKGSRRIKSKMASHIEPFTVGCYQVVRGKRFYILTGADKELTNNGFFLDVESYKDASYLCEILDLTMQEGVAEENIYILLKNLLQNISNYNSIKKSIALRYFEFSLLRSLGYSPNYQKCPKCNSDIIENDFFLGSFEGVFCCPDQERNKKISKNTLKLLRLFKEKSLEEILAIKDVEKHNNDLKEVILPYFYDILPRKPKSQEL